MPSRAEFAGGFDPRPGPEVLGVAQRHLHGFLRTISVSTIGASAAAQADWLQALSRFPPGNLSALYWQARVCLLRRVEDVDTFDAIFSAWFDDGTFAVSPPPGGDEDDEEEPPAPNPDTDGQLAAADTVEGTGKTASPHDLLGARTFPATRPEQAPVLAALTAAWPRALPPIRSRRLRPARRGVRLDARKVGRAASRTGGEIIHLHWRHRPRRPRKLLVLIDVSGSMQDHSADLLKVAYTAVRACQAVEVFTFGTRLTHVTEVLADRDIDRALAQLTDVVADVDGGTRIGDAFDDFLGHDHYRAFVRDAVVVIVSDGLERGDCTAMWDTTARLARLAHRLVWWSPLACDAAYRPVTRGMAGVLDHLDQLVGVRDLETGADAVRRLQTLADPALAPGTWHTEQT